MQTRSQSRTTTTSISNTRNYNNRLRNRILKLETNFDENPVNNDHRGPAYNTRLAHNVLSPKSYCLKNEIIETNVPPANHRYNTRYSTQYNNDIDFDEASREWNGNKRRVGQMYEYTN
jgi:hypothetical protein